MADRADSELIIGALLHDIGQLIPANTQRMVAKQGGSVGQAGHERIGAQYLQQRGFSPKVCALVGGHVAAKRYLSRDASYYAQLSDASKQSLQYQGGPYTDAQAAEFEQSTEWAKEILAVRQFDDAAKEPGLQVPPLGSYRTMVSQHLS